MNRIICVSGSLSSIRLDAKRFSMPEQVIGCPYPHKDSRNNYANPNYENLLCPFLGNSV